MPVGRSSIDEVLQWVDSSQQESRTVYLGEDAR